MENYQKPKSKKGRNIAIIIVVVFFLGLFFGGGFVVGKLTEGKLNYKVDPDFYQQTELPQVFKSPLIQQLWTILRTDFVDKENIDEKKMFYGALRGFVSGLEDPYTVFLDPQITKEFEIQINGKFEGIGAEIAIKDGILTIVSPIKGTPADQAGLMPGDKVFAVDGKETIGLSLEEAVRYIRGPKGTQVTLLIVRGNEEPQDVVITRGVIELKSVKWSFRDDGLAYLELSGFNKDTTTLMNQFVREYKNHNARGIILDLRNNPGGLLDKAIEVCSYWLEDKVVVIERFGDGREVPYSAQNSTELQGIPTVVLINQGSASGSEIVAGAFQDYEIAKIVGQTSFGKGSVQTLRKLPDGSSIKVTVAKWLTPDGRTIDEDGIAPDIEVERTREDFENERDPQLEKAVEILLSE